MGVTAVGCARECIIEEPFNGRNQEITGTTGRLKQPAISQSVAHGVADEIEHEGDHFTTGEDRTTAFRVGQGEGFNGRADLVGMPVAAKEFK